MQPPAPSWPKNPLNRFGACYLVVKLRPFQGEGGEGLSSPSTLLAFEGVEYNHLERDFLEVKYFYLSR